HSTPFSWSSAPPVHPPPSRIRIGKGGQRGRCATGTLHPPSRYKTRGTADGAGAPTHTLRDPPPCRCGCRHRASSPWMLPRASAWFSAPPFRPLSSRIHIGTGERRGRCDLRSFRRSYRYKTPNISDDPEARKRLLREPPSSGFPFRRTLLPPWQPAGPHLGRHRPESFLPKPTGCNKAATFVSS